MTKLTIETLKLDLIAQKEQLENEMVEPSLHINKCDIHDVAEAAEALQRRDQEHKLFLLKQNKVQKLESLIKHLEYANSIDDIECENCGVSILQRLSIVPTARRCVSCQSEAENKHK